jgi:hypothetical protein
VTVTWEDALTECEARLDAAESALDPRTAVPVAPFGPPAVDGPLPAPLAERARACCERGEALASQLAGELDRIRAELRRLPRMPRAPREAHFDAQA